MYSPRNELEFARSDTRKTVCSQNIQKTFYLLLTSIFLFIFSLLAEGLADQLPAIVVEDVKINESLTTPSFEKAREKTKHIQGGVNVVYEQEIRNGVTPNLQEVLSLSPGVWARSRFGSDEVRLSIRGSGISQTFNTRGVRLLRDGLPVSEADGNVRTQLIEPLNARYIEVYRGASALEYGGALLGGAINLVSPNARTQDSFPVRFEFGAHEYLRGQVAHGWVMNNGFDVYASLTGIEQNGFRANSEQETVRFYGNSGRRWNHFAETRFHLDLQDNNIELPGSLTKQQLETDPTQANAESLLRNSQRDINMFRLGIQHSVVLGNGAADFGVSYQHLDTRIPLSFAFLEADQNDVSVSGRVTQNRMLGNSVHNFVFGGLAVWGDNEGDRFRYAFADVKGTQSRDDDDRAWGLELFAQDRFALHENTEFIVGAQLIHASRKTSETAISQTGMEGNSVNRSEYYTGVNPRIGFTYQLNSDMQIFGNVSRSFEPPTVTEFSALLDDGSFEILDAQKATTFELGARGKLANLNIDFATYYSRLQDEILNQEDPSVPSGSGETVFSNADNTDHSGIEFGMQGELFPHVNVALSYTYNNFKFDDDNLWGNNELPGIPQHLLRAEIMYQMATGFYFGPTLDYSSDWYVDFANSFKANAYTIFGAKAGYNIGDDLRIFVQAINLDDKKYASNTAIADIADESSSLFNPGLERSVYVGLEWRM